MPTEPAGAVGAPTRSGEEPLRVGDPTVDFLRRYVQRVEELDADELILAIDRAILDIDRRMRAQVDAILAHPRFQALESAWSSLEYLVTQTPVDSYAFIRVLNVSREEVQADLEDAVEFDRSNLFNLIYEQQFGRLGGEPYAIVVADFDVGAESSDPELVQELSGIAAAAHAILLMGASPNLLGLESWLDLRPAAVPEELPEMRWNRLRERPDSRYVGLVFPRILLREPWSARDDGRWTRLSETSRRRLWGNASYALASRAIAAFHAYGWPVALRGLADAHGVVTGLPEESVSTDTPGLVIKPPVETCVTETMEKALGDLGLVPLCQVDGTHMVAFFAVPSLHAPRPTDDPTVDANRRLSAQLPYMLAASRISHYIKMLLRARVGSFATVDDVRRDIIEFLRQYTLDDEHGTAARKAKYPLRAFDVQIREKPGSPGDFEAITLLRPHYQIEDPNVALRLAIDLPTIGDEKGAGG